MSTVCFRDRAEQRVFFCIFLHDYVCIILASVINHNQAGFTVSGMRLNDRIPVIKYLSDISRSSYAGMIIKVYLSLFPR